VQVVVELDGSEVVQPGLAGLLLLEAPACTTEPGMTLLRKIGSRILLVGYGI
jgi:hypothetical protein